MAGASDKARFYLEQSIPELQELERKKVFTKVRSRDSLTCLFIAQHLVGRDIFHCQKEIGL